MSKKNIIMLVSIVVLLIAGTVIIKGCKKIKVVDHDNDAGVTVEEEKRNYDMAKCGSIVEDVKTEIDKLNTCTTNTDCVLLNGCPYGCNQLVNKDSDQTKLSNLVRSYYEDCPECEYQCRGALKAGQIKCEEGKCVGGGRQ
jgi:hypothetical protein